MNGPRLALLLPLLLLGVSRAGGDVDVAPVKGMTALDRQDLERNLRWMLQRARAGKGAKARVGVYADAGVWYRGARSVVDALEQEGIACRVLDRTLLTAAGLKGLEAVVVPGGWAPFERDGAGPAGLKALAAFVRGGGRYLGVCAGAYLVAKEVRWGKARYPYPVGWWGVVEGPIPGLAPWPSSSPVRVTPTPSGKQRGLGRAAGKAVLYRGGGRFLGAKAGEVLARYPDGTAAVVARRVGKGEVVLSGVHFERPAPGPKGDAAPPPKLAGRLLAGLLRVSR